MLVVLEKDSVSINYIHVNSQSGSLTGLYNDTLCKWTHIAALVSIADDRTFVDPLVLPWHTLLDDEPPHVLPLDRRNRQLLSSLDLFPWSDLSVGHPCRTEDDDLWQEILGQSLELFVGEDVCRYMFREGHIGHDRRSSFGDRLETLFVLMRLVNEPRVEDLSDMSANCRTIKARKKPTL